jgi:teichuronic acid biosynthesis glycosyltransferase TuaG
MHVGIVVCAFNASDTLQVCLSGIQKQTHPHWTCLVFDDGSTDATLEIAHSFGQLDARFTIVHSARNRGLSRSRNLAIRLLNTDWLAFCDADDIWLSNKLEMQLKWLPEKNFICSLSQYINHDTGYLSPVVKVPGSLSYSRLLMGNPIGMSTVLLHRSLLKGLAFVPPAPDRVHEDYALWVVLFRKKQPRAKLIKESLAWIGISTKTMSSNKWRAWRSHYAVLRKCAKMNAYTASMLMLSYAFLAIYKRGLGSLYSQYKK